MLKESRRINWKESEGGYVLLSDAQFFVAVRPGQEVRLGEVRLTHQGELFIPKGYWWDGASGPAIDTHTNMRASLVHDVLILMVQGNLLDRSIAIKGRVDMEYYRLAREDGMFLLRAIGHLLAIQFNKWQKKVTPWAR